MEDRAHAYVLCDGFNPGKGTTDAVKEMGTFFGRTADFQVKSRSQMTNRVSR